MIDWQKVNQLREDVGEEDFAEVIDLFLQEVEETLALFRSDGRSPKDDAHFLKGSALNLGFVAFADLCAKTEQGQPTKKDVLLACYQTSRAALLSKHMS